MEGGVGCIADGRNMRMLPTEYTTCNDLNAVRKLEVLLGDCSRVLLLPPPLLAFTPYFSKYVQFRTARSRVEVHCGVTSLWVSGLEFGQPLQLKSRVMPDSVPD